jgi:hypothetical protein
VKKQRRSRRDAAGTVGELAAMAPHSSLPLLIGLRSGCQSSRPCKQSVTTFAKTLFCRKKKNPSGTQARKCSQKGSCTILLKVLFCRKKNNPSLTQALKCSQKGSCTIILKVLSCRRKTESDFNLNSEMLSERETVHNLKGFVLWRRCADHGMAMQRSSTSGSGDHRRAHKYPSTRSSIHVSSTYIHVLLICCCSNSSSFFDSSSCFSSNFLTTISLICLFLPKLH